MRPESGVLYWLKIRSFFNHRQGPKTVAAFLGLKIPTGIDAAFSVMSPNFDESLTVVQAVKIAKDPEVYREIATFKLN